MGFGFIRIKRENGRSKVLEEIYEKYEETVDVGPETKLLMMIGGSAVKFHLTRTVLKSVMPSAESLLKQNPKLKEDISNLINKMKEKE